MAISITLDQYLSDNKINYQLVQHRRTNSSLDSSHSAHLPITQVSKSVILQGDAGDYLMATLPAGHRLSIKQLNQLTGENYHLISEQRLLELFPDCEQGAIPGVGEAFNIKMMVDDALLKVDPVFIEAGDHHHLLKIGQQQYLEMLADTPHGDICGSAIGMPRLAKQVNSERTLS